MYAKIINNEVISYPYNLSRLYKDNPNVSFPKTIPEGVLNSYNIYSVAEAPVPSYSVETQKAVEVDPTLVNGVWTRAWSISSQAPSDAEMNVRSKRDALLQETDYLALSDQTLSAAMSAYRQALRDITSQSGFPFSVTWPTKP